MSASPELDPSEEPCFHCGASLASLDTVFEVINEESRGFCCRGCLGAAEFINGLGLFAYYDRRDPPTTALSPIEADPARIFSPFDDEALQATFVTVHDNGERSATLSVAGMRCAACCWLLEECLARRPGVSNAQFGLVNQRARVRWDPEAIQLSKILGQIAELGYRAEPFEPDAEEALLRAERRVALRRLGVSGLGTMQVMMFSVGLYTGAFADLEDVHRDLLRVASLVVTTPVLFYAGWPFLFGAFRDLRAKRIGPDVPIGLALTVAYSASVWTTLSAGTVSNGGVYFDSVCMFIFFITLGRTLERDLRAKAELRIRNLQRRVPQTAHRIEAGVATDVPATLLAVGDVVSLHPGEHVPADGLVIEGEGNVSESLLTGEESPVPKSSGSPILAGSENVDGALLMRVERIGAASTLQQIATLLDRVQLEKTPVAQLANRLARIFLTSVVVATAGVALYWWWADPSQLVPVIVSVLIATCPCALSLATPTAFASATHGLAARGFLITRGHALEALARVTRVAFDKTGTLTSTMPKLAAIHPLREGVSTGEAKRLAVILERNSHHPLARAVRAAAGPRPPLREVTSAEPRVEAGSGVSGRVEGRILRFGRPDWSAALSGSDFELGPSASGPETSTSLLADKLGPIARFEFETRLRPKAETVTTWLANQGYRLAVLSGDPSREAVASVARQLGIEDVAAGASPGEKLVALERWIAAGETVAAVGDGANDAPLLGRAHVSLGMGSGSDLARLRADAVLLDDRLELIPLAIVWARKTRAITRQNFAWALAYNLCALPLAATGSLPPYAAAIGMSLSSLLVVGNSLRLRHGPPDPLRKAMP
ncbi:MAG: Cu2+-exporting ATPase [Myxococcota bacterium]|jgi:Cu2+-exporting ATPase